LPVRRRIHAGQVYLGKEVLQTLGVRDGDEVELEIRGGELVIRPVRELDENTLDLLKILREIKAGGGHEDYFEEYDYDDIGE